MAKKEKKAKKDKQAKKDKKIKKIKKIVEAKVAPKDGLDDLKDELSADAIQASYEAKQPKSRTYTLRCTDEDLTKWKAAAEQKEVSLSALITSLLDVYCSKLA